METRKTSEPQKRGSWLLGNDLVGHKWAKMEVIAQADKPEGNNLKFRGTWWLCRCACGKEKVLPRQYITQETVKSCGCLRAKPEKQPRQEAPEPEQEPKEAPAGRMKLSKQDITNLKHMMTECKCRQCKKRFVRTSKDWKYTRIINGHKHDYCSWDCYRGKPGGKKMSLTERARLQSEAAGA